MPFIGEEATRRPTFQSRRSSFKIQNFVTALLDSLVKKHVTVRSQCVLQAARSNDAVRRVVPIARRLAVKISIAVGRLSSVTDVVATKTGAQMHNGRVQFVSVFRIL